MTFQRTHQPCPDQTGCRSSDAASVNEDGSIWCFSCQQLFQGEAIPDEAQRPTPKPAFSAVENLLITGRYSGDSARGITADTAKLFKSLKTEDKTYYAYYDKTDPTKIVAAKMRYPDKRFPWVGEVKQAGLFGQQLFSPAKFCTITEGEEDAQAAYQLLGSKYPVVSIRNGAAGALADCKAAYEWLDKFETLVFCFDSDEPGRKAAAECAQLFGGKARIMQHPTGIKDSCDYYVNGRTAEFSTTWWKADRFTPDGIVLADQFREALKSPVPPPRWHYPWKGLDRMLQGIREAELVTWCAGSGVGKSSALRELVYSTLLNTTDHVGVAFLEETPERTLRGLAGLHLNKPIHLHGTEYAPSEIDQCYDDLGIGHRVSLWDHWGSTDLDNVISRLKYFVKAMDCSIVVLDHISIVVSGEATQNERQKIDELMTRLRSEVVQQTGCSLHIVTHLSRPDGKPLENGAPVTLSLLRGSGSIAQLSDAVIACERDTQAEDASVKNTTTLRVLKSRWIGDTGIASHLNYNKNTGRLTELGAEML